MSCLASSFRRSAFLVLLLSLSHCARGPMSPDPGGMASPFVGTWRGTISDDSAGQGSVEIVIENSDQFGVSGNWKATYPSQSYSGSLRSTNPPVTSFSATCVPNGSLLLPLAVSGSHMTGTYLALVCPALSRGAVDLTKQ